MWGFIQLYCKKMREDRFEFRNSNWRCSIEKVVLKNLAKFTRKHLYQSVFLKKRLWHKCFSCHFRKIFKNISGRLLLLIKRKGKNVPIQLTFIGNLHSLKRRWFEEGLSTCVSVMNFTPIWCRLASFWNFFESIFLKLNQNL